jgi:hypothetical protein
MITDGQEPSRRRTSIEERAERRSRMERTGGDRYSNLLHALRAGREVRPTPMVRDRLEWNPIARKLIIAVLVGVALYAIASAGYRFWRQQNVDTWTGPDASVTSGQQLAGCAAAEARDYDPVYPVWVRYGGAVFVGTGFGRPFPADVTGSYQASPYHLGQMTLWRVLNTPEGRAGNEIVLKYDPDPVGEMFAIAPGCS